MTDPEEETSDYEEYWVKRDKIEGLEDPVEEPQATPEQEAPKFRETYVQKDEEIEVTIWEAIATIEYSNGTVSEVPVSELKFCPSCVKEGKYPFSRHGDSCPTHKVEFFDFDITRFEEFKVLSQLNGYHS